MDAYQAIVSKRDRRRFTSDPVDEADLRRVLQAGRMAGSAKNSQVSRIVVVTDADDRERLARCGDFAGWLPRAPVVLVLGMPTEGGRLFDLGRMAQNMMVAANSLGLGSCPVTFHRPDCVIEVLGIPDGYVAPMGVGLGWPGPPDPSKQGSPRIPLEELVHHGRWGPEAQPAHGS